MTEIGPDPSKRQVVQPMDHGAKNLLNQETSPYLLQHQDNPVHWRGWNEAAFAEAKAAGKPVLLSVGYAACHWCHVMAHESFENPDIAAVMNELFINIKVDREERPDIDAIYQTALAVLGEHGGWPLTMFLTPDGEPFWGGTYFPPEPRWGRPGFPEVLRSLADAYHNRPDDITRNAAAIKQAVAKASASNPGAPLSRKVIDAAAVQIAAAIDPQHGGLPGAPKFPQVPLFALLWRVYLETGQEILREAVVRTVTAMSLGGIYDHIGGGYARYSTDEVWLVPHFEKMLYDNAQLIDLLSDVWKETRAPLLQTRVEETVAWLLREMINRDPEVPQSAQGGFAATLDADSEGVEGKFYVWSEAEVDEILGAEAAAFKTAYDVTTAGNWEHHNILNRMTTPYGDVGAEKILAKQAAQLKQVRDQRIWPGWDDKVLADWNGLAITALVKAGLTFDQPEWISAAKSAFAFVSSYLRRDQNRLWHSWRKAKAAHPAILDDYAAMMRGALALYSATGDADYLAVAETWAATVESFYRDPAGGYFLTASDTPALLVRTKTVVDSATPSGNGLLLAALSYLYLITGKDIYRDRAAALTTSFSGGTDRLALAGSSFVAATRIIETTVQIVIIGGGKEAEALRRSVLDLPLPDLLVISISDPTQLPQNHPAAGKTLIDGKPAAYVCRGFACDPPETDPDQLRRRLQA